MNKCRNCFNRDPGKDGLCCKCFNNFENTILDETERKGWEDFLKKCNCREENL